MTEMITGQTAAGTGVIPSFADVPLRSEEPRHTEGPAADSAPASAAEHIAAAAAAHGYTAEQLDWHTPENIVVKPLFTSADRDVAVSAGYPLDSFPGAAPFIRGP